MGHQGRGKGGGSSSNAKMRRRGGIADGWHDQWNMPAEGAALEMHYGSDAGSVTTKLASAV